MSSSNRINPYQELLRNAENLARDDSRKDRKKVAEADKSASPKPTAEKYVVAPVQVNLSNTTQFERTSATGHSLEHKNAAKRLYRR